ncbi:hypothetical protein EDB19DRAFT_756396 [Suillus lakei]|nr:hypothetical protein EDB19DRAFT_756396 [Suillus lakei]
MILTNFMRKNVKRKTKVTKSSGILPRPDQSPTSPALSAPPEEIFDIHEGSSNSRVTEEPPTARDTSVDRPSTSTARARLNVGSSLVQLDYNPEPLDNWFPQELLNGEPGSHEPTWNLPMSPPQESAIAEATALNTAREDLNMGPTFEGAITANMTSHSRQLSDRRALNRSIPAPIFIPEVENTPTMAPTRRPTVNVEPLGTNQQPFPSTSPPSPMDSDNMSAISGTTLARALIGNSFILSSSDRGSRYRSGMTRQDSATLPRGDHLLTDLVRAYGSGRDSTVPPVPPLPSGSGAPLLDQARASVQESQEPPDASASTTESPSSGAYYSSPDIIMHSRLSRRISRISEVPSPVPTTPMSPQSIRDARPMKSGSSIAASSMLARMDETDSDVPNTASHTPATGSSHRSLHHTGTGVSSTSIQSSEFFPPSPTDGLDGYNFVAPDPPQPIAFTSSDVSDVSAYLQTKSSDVSLRKRRARALGATPSLRGGRSFKATEVLSSSIFQRNKKHIRLPISERPRSILVPQTPITPALIASSTVQYPSVLSQFPLVPTSAVPAGHIEMPLTAFAELDILDASPLSSAGIFAQRQRTERGLGTPGRVTGSQEYDLLDYAIDASPKSQSSPTYPSSSSSAREQTFPETPNIFTPLFSPNFPVPITALQLPGRPQAPRSATLPVPEEFASTGALSRAMTLNVPPRGEGLAVDNSSSAPRRPVSTASPMKSTPSPEPLPHEIASEIAPVPVCPLTGEKTHTTDPKAPHSIAYPQAAISCKRTKFYKRLHPILHHQSLQLFHQIHSRLHQNHSLWSKSLHCPQHLCPSRHPKIHRPPFHIPALEAYLH